MKKSGFSLSQLKTTIDDQKAEWQPDDTEISVMPLEQQLLRLGVQLTENELRLISQFKLETPTPWKDLKFKALKTPVGLPATIDWRDHQNADWTTPIRDQESCGSCVAFGTIAALEALLKIRIYQNPGTSVDLSEAHLLFCGGGSCSGWHMDKACDYLKGNGVPPEDCFPYSRGLAVRRCDTCSDWASRIDHTKIKSWSNTKDVAEMKRRLVENGPQITGMAVYRDFMNYAGGVYQYVQGDLLGYHCVAVVGYDDSAQCWICKNSWGTGWGEAHGGERGWFRIKYGQCGVDNVFGMWDMEVVRQATSGYASYLLVDYSFTSGARYLWAYSEDQWRYAPLTDGQVQGIAKVLMEAGRVYVWWDGSKITQVRAIK